MTPSPASLLRFLSRATGPVLVVHDASSSDSLRDLAGDHTHHLIGAPGPGAPQRWPAVAVVCAEALSLRRSVSVMPPLGRSRLITWWLLAAEEPALAVPRAEWPEVISQDGRALGAAGAFTTLRTDRPVGVNAVLEEVARTLAPSVPRRSGLVVATTSGHPASAPPASPGLIVVERLLDAADPTRDVPPDVVLVTEPGSHVLPRHEVIDRAPVVVSETDPLAAPLDEGLLNPTGFLRHPSRGLVHLTAEPDQPVHVVGDGIEERQRHEVGVPSTVAALREYAGVSVQWAYPPRADQVRAVTALALAGVPIISDDATAAEGRLGSRLTAALAHSVDLTSPLRREEHSVRLRRAALRECSTLAWQERLATAAGISFQRFPTCSVILCTKRPQNLDFALRQVNRQRDVDLELILVAHGFAPDARAVAVQSHHPCTVVRAPDAHTLGEALNLGVSAASGELVVKMDDDDWYGPDFVTDLLAARHYSGADLVGMPAEFVYLGQADRMIRRTDDSERIAETVAGGTMMIGRSLLRELGGFRPLRSGEDVALAADVRAVGGDIYRTHGLGYVLRRGSRDHTWVAPEEYFTDESRIDELWDGFVPSQLLEPADQDRPRPKETSA